MQGKFVIKPTKDGGYEICLKTANGRILLTEVTFKAKASGLKSIESGKTDPSRQGWYEYDVKSAGRA